MQMAVLVPYAALVFQLWKIQKGVSSESRGKISLGIIIFYMEIYYYKIHIE